MAASDCSSPQHNACLHCGACCAFYRASFHWTEADDAGGTVPLEMTEDRDVLRRAMKGTNQAPPRCVALDGDIGIAVACAIYEQRSSTCREFAVAWEGGEANEKCDRARIAWGLPPLPPPDAMLELAAAAIVADARGRNDGIEAIASDGAIPPEIAAAALRRTPWRPRPR
jgi:Fe-S-cluster containining protein